VKNFFVCCAGDSKLIFGRDMGNCDTMARYSGMPFRRPYILKRGALGLDCSDTDYDEEKTPDIISNSNFADLRFFFKTRLSDAYTDLYPVLH
jgi:hypothetical protein